MNKKIEIFFFTFLLFIFSLSGCKKFTDPKLEEGDAHFFDSDEGARMMVVGIYSQMNKNISFENSGITLFSGFSADELTNVFPDAEKNQFEENKLISDNENILTMWTSAFSTILQINTCIEGLQKSTAVTTALKKQLLGEAFFCRAFEYFYLVNFWGDVPLVTSSDWRLNKSLGRSAKQIVYGQINTDLNEALSLMTDEYPTTGKIRPNRFTAAALLARVCLYQQNWTEAEKLSNLVINSGKYNLQDSLNEVFLKNSKEAIWQLEPTNKYGATAEGQLFMKEFTYSNGEKLPDYSLRRSFVASVEPGDGRKTSWMKKFSGPYQSYYPYKYKDSGFYGNTDVKEYYMVLRLAEQYLIRAEARAHLNRITEAISDVNIIRRRARGTAGPNVLPDVKGIMDLETCLSVIERERRIELFCEWGHRWFDLKRNNRTDVVIGALKSSWKSTAVLYPIPIKEITSNTALVQNSGY